MRLLIVCIIWLGLLSPLQAKEVKGLFEVDLVANSQSAEDRLIAMKQGMYIVLSRIIVADDIAQIPIAQQLMLNPNQYIKQFQYSLVAADTNGDSDLRMVRMEFDEDQLLEVLRKNPVSLWGDIRPETLLWLVIDQDGKREFYNPDIYPEVDNALTTASKTRGLPLIFPMLDLEEQQTISVGEVLGADSRHLLKISSRYEVPSIMSGRLLKKGECWLSEWAFYFDGKIKQWNTPCQALLPTVQAGVSGAFGVLAGYYGAKPLNLTLPPQP